MKWILVLFFVMAALLPAGAIADEPIYVDPYYGKSAADDPYSDGSEFHFQLFYGKVSASDADVSSSWSGWFSGTTSADARLEMEADNMLGFRATRWSTVSAPAIGFAFDFSYLKAESVEPTGDSASVRAPLFAVAMLVHDPNPRARFAPYIGFGFGIHLFSSIDTDLAPVGPIGGSADAGFFPDLRLGIRFKPFKSWSHFWVEWRQMPLKFKYETDFNITSASKARLDFDASTLWFGFEF